MRSGTALFVDFSQDEVTIAADSRSTLETGEHDDTECKISAFGDKFVFTMAGLRSYRVQGGWDAHSVAREVWKQESRPGRTADDLVLAVAKRWIAEMVRRYGRPELITDTRKRTAGGEPILATALFAATDQTNSMLLMAVSTLFDRELFDSDGRIRLTSEVNRVSPPDWVAGGRSEVAEEFRRESTDRAKSYMSWFRNEISDLNQTQQRAALAKKLIELSILLHPNRDEFAFPIDVLQLRRNAGVYWTHRKANCPAD